MPIDMRVILYPDHEVVAALAAHFRKIGKPLAIGTIARYRIEPGDKVAVDLGVETVDGQIVDYKISEDDLYPALLMAAAKEKVPLPPEADKKLHVVDSYVTLIVRTRGGRQAGTASSIASAATSL
jgi:hypothetical protein